MKEGHVDWCSAHSPPLVSAPYCPAEGHKEDGDTPAMAWHRPAPSSVGTKLRRWCGFLTLNESDDCPNKDASGQSWRRQWCGRAQTSSCLPWTLRRVQAGTKISVCVIFCSNPVTLHWHDCGTAAFPPRCRHIIPWRLNVYECANIRKIFLNTHRKRTKKNTNAVTGWCLLTASTVSVAFHLYPYRLRHFGLYSFHPNPYRQGRWLITANVTRHSGPSEKTFACLFSTGHHRF